MKLSGHGAGRCGHPQCATLSRRQFVASAVALGAAGMIPGTALAAPATLIDTHHHFYPPEYQKLWLDYEDSRKIPHFPGQVAWSQAKAIEEMEKAGVRTAVLSIA
jgi:hypothetical protein